MDIGCPRFVNRWIIGQPRIALLCIRFDDRSLCNALQTTTPEKTAIMGYWIDALTRTRFRLLE